MNATAKSVAVHAPQAYSQASPWFACGSAIVLFIAGAKLLLHLLMAARYGYSGDELYHMACGEHLACGYVDQPPLIALIAWFVRHALGTSLFAIHLLPALAGVALVWLTGVITRELGGGRFAGTRGVVRCLRGNLPDHASPVHHECLRAVALDGLRLPCDPNHQDGRTKAVVVVWPIVRDRVGEQILDGSFRTCHRGRTAVDRAAQGSRRQVDLGGRRASLPDLPAQPPLEYSARLAIY